MQIIFFPVMAFIFNFKIFYNFGSMYRGKQKLEKKEETGDHTRRCIISTNSTSQQHSYQLCSKEEKA